jgi:DNA-binding CsgD family transcriptional regulator
MTRIIVLSVPLLTFGFLVAAPARAEDSMMKQDSMHMSKPAHHMKKDAMMHKDSYPKEWQRRYFFKQYFLIDPVIILGSTSSAEFDWADIDRGSQVISDFFSDALSHAVGSNGLSIPIQNRKNMRALVSFTNDLPRPDWERFKSANMDKLYHASALIDAASVTGLKLPDALEVNLSAREEQCLVWAARGKTYEEIGEITNLSFYSVRSHLDMARLKLRGTNLTHAVAVALALGVIPSIALRGSL